MAFEFICKRLQNASQQLLLSSHPPKANREWSPSSAFTCISEAAHRWAVSGGPGAVRPLVGQACCYWGMGPGRGAATHPQRVFLGLEGMGMGLGLGVCVGLLLAGTPRAAGRAHSSGCGAQAFQLGLQGIQDVIRILLNYLYFIDSILMNPCILQ